MKEKSPNGLLRQAEEMPEHGHEREYEAGPRKVARTSASAANGGRSASERWIVYGRRPAGLTWPASTRAIAALGMLVANRLLPDTLPAGWPWRGDMEKIPTRPAPF